MPLASSHSPNTKKSKDPQKKYFRSLSDEITRWLKIETCEINVRIGGILSAEAAGE